MAGMARADARGTVTVTKSSGLVQTYTQVRIRTVGDTAVAITSADGRSTLIVDKAACTFAGELQRCLPYDITLDKSGVKHPLDLERGILYVNDTEESRALPHSSMQVFPHCIMLALHTERGTFISVVGRIDGESK
jgi:hypothetical protein